MCGRFDNLIDRDSYHPHFNALRLPASIGPLRYNVRPDDQIAIVRVDEIGWDREVVVARWGLALAWMGHRPKVRHITARSETVHVLPIFRDAFVHRRCLIPATGFYEWERNGARQPWRFVRRDLEPFAFAGIWEQAPSAGGDVLSAAIILGDPSGIVAAIRAPMPVILQQADYQAWLDPIATVEEAHALLEPFDEGSMTAYEVGRAVNSPRNDAPECIAPLSRAS
jgi:putative SOS response-associated peptidase YedK